MTHWLNLEFIFIYLFIEVIFYSHCILASVCYLFTLPSLCTFLVYFSMHNFFRNLIIFCMNFEIPLIRKSFLASWSFSKSVICLNVHFELLIVSIMVNWWLHSYTAMTLTFRAWISSHFDAAYIRNSTKEVIDFDKLSIKVPKSTSTTSTRSSGSRSSKLISCTFAINCTLNIIWIDLEWIRCVLF